MIIVHVIIGPQRLDGVWSSWYSRLFSSRKLKLRRYFVSMLAMASFNLHVAACLDTKILSVKFSCYTTMHCTMFHAERNDCVYPVYFSFRTSVLRTMVRKHFIDAYCRSMFSHAHTSLLFVLWILHSRHCLKMSIPNKSLQRRTVQSEILIPWVPRSAWSWYAVISSWRRIRCSTKHLTSHDTIDGLPDPGRRTIEPVASYFFRNLSTPHLLASKLFSWRWQAIVRGLYLRKQ